MLSFSSVIAQPFAQVEKSHLAYANTATDFMLFLSTKQDLAVVVEISACDEDGVIIHAKKS
jgi:hypothetical protein